MSLSVGVLRLLLMNIVAAEPAVYNWYVREFDIDFNLFVDHSQVVQLSCLRSRI